MKKYLGFILLSLIMSCTNKKTNIPVEINSNSIHEKNTYNKYINDINSQYLLEKTNNINDCRIFSSNDIFFGNDDAGIVSNASVNIFFDKNQKITEIVNLSNGINQYRINNNLDGYLFSKNVYETNEQNLITRFSDITKLINGKVSNNVFSFDSQMISYFTTDNLFLDSDKNRFYISSYSLIEKTLKLYFFENMKLVKEETLETNSGPNISSQVYFMNNKEGLLLYQKDATSFFFKRISDFKIIESFNITTDFRVNIIGLNFNLNGNGIIFYKDSKDNIYYKKINSYIPEKFDNLESSMVDSLNKDNKKLFSADINNDGNGLIAWSDKENNVFTKPVNNFNISDNITKISTNNNEKINLHLKVNSQRQALIIWNEPNPKWVEQHRIVNVGSNLNILSEKDYCNEIVIKKINY